MRRSSAFLWLHRRKVLAGAVVGALLLGNRGFRNLVFRTLELSRLRKESESLKKEESALTAQLEQMKKSDYALETAARRELGYIKPGEVEYRFPPPK